MNFVVFSAKFVVLCEWRFFQFESSGMEYWAVIRNFESD